MKQEDIDRAIASGNKVLEQLKRVCPKPEESAPVALQTTAKRVRQRSGDGMNKLERSALGMLRKRHPNWMFRPHCLRVEIANGVTMIPDIVGLEPGHRPHMIEVKGPHAWEDSLIKLKVAAREWPHFHWWLVWKKDDKWQSQEILP